MIIKQKPKKNIMKNTLLITIALLFGIISANAQDYIYKKNDGGRIEATNVKVLLDQTTYSLYGNESGEVYTISNDDISMITFENGSVQFFERESKAKQRHSFKKNLINYHLFDLIVNNFKISYERILSNGKLGIQIPVAIGYGDKDNISGFDDVHNTFYTGISLNFYPTGQGKVRYFMGPGIQVGTGYFDDGYYNEYSSQYINENIDTFVFRFLVNNGIIFTPIDALSISLVGSLGIRYTDKTDHYDDENIKTVGAFAANLSYRF